MDVYLDVILIENFIIDLFLLIVTFNILRIKVKSKRLIISALIGSIYTIVIIFDELRFFSSMCFEFVMAYIIVLISLGRKRKITALKAGGIYIINALILSGLCYYFSQKELGYSFIKGTTINNFSSKYIIISASLLAVITLYEKIDWFRIEKGF